jgi:hypothetical protein
VQTRRANDSNGDSNSGNAQHTLVLDPLTIMRRAMVDLPDAWMPVTRITA